MEKKLDGNYIRMPWAILNTSWRQHPTKQQLYGHLLPITKTIKVRRNRHCWRSKDDILLWSPSQGRAKAGRPATTYIQQLCADTGCSPEDLLGAMDDRVGWREKVRESTVCLLFIVSQYLLSFNKNNFLLFVKQQVFSILWVARQSSHSYYLIVRRRSGWILSTSLRGSFKHSVGKEGFDKANSRKLMW